jgi:hypothetical protein
MLTSVVPDCPPREGPTSCWVVVPISGSGLGARHFRLGFRDPVEDDLAYLVKGIA